MEKLNGKEATQAKATEVKLATITYQWTKSGQSPYKQIGVRAQTTNENSAFNVEMARACMKAEKWLREEKYKVSFLNATNDGVKSDSEFVKNALTDFLQGKSSFPGETDCNHNVKNNRYQNIIGGNTVKTIGSVLIDNGILKKAKVSQELWKVKDFASDLLVLRLASNVTVEAIFTTENINEKSIIALA